ncbi:MAG: hypothetical protein LQ346_002809 [Caloplaca aetnensis]|nr:MAG: hypothetical protein LQ346_002809 [Caloplaca aetnensis]
MAQEYAATQPQGFKNYIENVAIVGLHSMFTIPQAAGYSGKYIVEELLRNGKQKVTAITREGGTSQMPAGIDVKKVNYDDHAALTEALRGQDALIITMGVRAPPEQQTKLIEAAAAAGVPWVLPNEFGNDNANESLRTDVMINAVKTQYREHIEKLGKSSWIGIACGFWYEFSLGGGPDTYGFDLKNRSLVLFDDGTQAISTSTLPQVGRGVANLLGLKILRDDENDKSPCLSDFKNKFAYIASFVVNQKEMLESVLRVTKTEEKDWKITHEPTKERYERGNEMFKAGSREGMRISMYTRNFYPDGSGNFAVTRGLDNDKFGLPKEDLDEYTTLAIQWATDGTLARYGQ